MLGHLAAAEYEALEDGERLETAAALKRGAADLDDAAATVALADAERLRRARIATEESLAATEEAAATLEADVRAVAAAAAARRRSARAADTPRSRKNSAGSKKK